MCLEIRISWYLHADSDEVLSATDANSAENGVSISNMARVEFEHPPPVNDSQIATAETHFNANEYDEKMAALEKLAEEM